MKKLYLEGHHRTKGYAVSLELTDQAPVRFYKLHPVKVRAIIARFNRRFAAQ